MPLSITLQDTWIITRITNSKTNKKTKIYLFIFFLSYFIIKMLNCLISADFYWNSQILQLTATIYSQV